MNALRNVFLWTPEQREVLAQSNPVLFIRIMRSLIDAYIASRPEGKRETLRRLQWGVDLKVYNEMSFDARAHMAKQHPDLFEGMRDQVNEATRGLSGKLNDARALGLQWQIDTIREKHQTPLGACIELTEMMNESMWGSHGLHAALQTMSDGRTRSSAEASSDKKKATILPFSRKKE